MNGWIFFAFALAMLVGFASHRASLCTVRAVAEFLGEGSSRRLASFAKAAAWTAAISGALLFFTAPSASPVLERLPHGFALAGGFVFGVGAAINGGCSLSTLQRLADGDPGMLATLAGFIAGVLLWAGVDQWLALSALQPLPSFWRSEHAWRLPVLIVLWLWVAREAWQLWRASGIGEPLHRRLAHPHYRPATAAALLGVAGGLLFTLQGAWTYTNYLRAEAASWLGAAATPTRVHGLLLAALFLGMVLSSQQRRAFAFKPPGFARMRQNLAGGLLMGVGSALVPGGNDTLILAAIPSISLWAMGVYAALLAGVAFALMTQRTGDGGRRTEDGGSQ